MMRFSQDRDDGSGCTYQRVCPLVMAHSNGMPILLFDVARRFVRAHASFMRSSTVSVKCQRRILAQHDAPTRIPADILARHMSLCDSADST